MAKVELTKAQKIKRRRRHIRIIRGAFFLLFAVIGIISVINFTAGTIKTALSDEDDKEEYAALIDPLVSLDPVPFESIDQANETVLEQSVIWAVLQNEDTSKYGRNEYDQIMIPTVDFDRYFAKMYGSDNIPVHATFTDGDLTFEYDGGEQAYIIPITSQTSTYHAIVVDISTSHGVKTLTVAYAQYESSNAIVDPTSNQMGSTIAKYMQYTLVRDGSNYVISAVGNSDYVPEE